MVTSSKSDDYLPRRPQDATELAGMAQLSEELRRLAEATDALDIRGAESKGPDAIETLLIHDVDSLCDHANAILDRVSLPEDVARSEEAIPEVIRDLDNVAFMLRWELQVKRAGLDVSRHSRDKWEMIGSASSIRRRLLKIAAIVEEHLAASEGRTPALVKVFRSERERSVATRLAYRGFRDKIRQVARVLEEDVLRQVRRIGIAVAWLVGRDVYPDLRIHDRKQIRLLQERVMQWLTNRSATVLAGRRICQDAASLAELLMEVNRRQDLREHDKELLANLLETPPESSGSFRERAGSLLGLDEELDGLLLGDEREELDPSVMEHFRRLMYQITHSSA